MTSYEPESAEMRYRQGLDRWGGHATPEPVRPPVPRQVRVEGVGSVSRTGAVTRVPPPAPRTPARPSPAPSRRAAARPAPRVTAGARVTNALDVLERAELDAYRAQDQIARDATQW